MRERERKVLFGQCSFSGLASIEHEGKTFGVARTEARAINIRQSCGPPFNARSISSPEHASETLPLTFSLYIYAFDFNEGINLSSILGNGTNHSLIDKYNRTILKI